MGKKFEKFENLKKKVKSIVKKVDMYMAVIDPEHAKKKKANKELLKAIGLQALWMFVMLVASVKKLDDITVITYILFWGQIIVGGKLVFSFIKWLIAYKNVPMY